MTTTDTHEAAERRLRDGLEKTLPDPHVVIRYSPAAACDFRALWVLGERLFDLEVEVNTTRKKGKKARADKPLEEDFRRSIERIARIVAPSVTAADPNDHAPVVAYARVLFRKRPARYVRRKWVLGSEELLIETVDEKARLLLGRAWDVGGRP